MAYVLKADYGLDLPRGLQIEFSKRVQEAHGHAGGPCGCDTPDDVRDRLGGKRHEDLPLGAHAFRDLEREASVDGRRSRREEQVVAVVLDARLPTESEQVAESLGRHERDRCGGALHDHVRRQRRPVHGTRNGAGVDGSAVEHLTDPVDDPAARIIRRGEYLADGDAARAVGEDDVGERAADVNADEVGALLGHRGSAIRW